MRFETKESSALPPIVMTQQEVTRQLDGDTTMPLHIGFMIDKLVFPNDPIATMVAKSNGGIDVVSGQIDMVTYEGAKAAAAYFAEHPRQPFVVANRVFNGDKLVYMSGVLGVVADIPQPLGIHPDRLNKGWTKAGLACVGAPSADFHYYLNDTQDALLVPHYPPYPHGQPVLDLVQGNHTYAIGTPIKDDDGRRTIQDIVAGAEIIPWLVEQFASPRTVYAFYRDMVASLSITPDVSEDMLDPLLIDPFLSYMRQEFEMLASAKRITEEGKNKLARIQRMAAAAVLEVGISLEELGDTYAGVAFVSPRTNTSYPVNCLAPLDTQGHQLEERIDSLKKSMGRIHPALIRAAQEDL